MVSLLACGTERASEPEDGSVDEAVADTSTFELGDVSPNPNPNVDIDAAPSCPPNPSACPANPPAAKTPCSTERQLCEYGDSPWPLCNVIFLCFESKWTPYTYAAAGLDAGCETEDASAWCAPTRPKLGAPCDDAGCTFPLHDSCGCKCTIMGQRCSCGQWTLEEEPSFTGPPCP